MNCDSVFDILTRGPFPSGSPDDAAVELHLQACHECRRLAEALRPAVDLFHESVSAEQSRDLPGYRGELATPAEKLTHQVQTAIADNPHKKRRRDPWRAAKPLARYGVGRYAAAVVLGLALGTLLWALSGWSNTPWNAPPRLADKQSTLAMRYQPDTKGKLMLAKLQLPAACLPPDMARHDEAHAEYAPSSTTEATVGRAVFLCCTQCHNTTQPDRPSMTTVAFATFESSCRACHLAD